MVHRIYPTYKRILNGNNDISLLYPLITYTVMTGHPVILLTFYTSVQGNHRYLTYERILNGNNDISLLYPLRPHTVMTGHPVILLTFTRPFQGIEVFPGTDV